jgi:hypothetical protein
MMITLDVEAGAPPLPCNKFVLEFQDRPQLNIEDVFQPAIAKN